MENKNLKKALSKLLVGEKITLSKADYKEYKNLNLDDSLTFDAYANAGTMLLTRTLPYSYDARAKYFNSITKTQVKTSLKDNNYVKVYAAASLSMSPRTFRRKLDTLGINF